MDGDENGNRSLKNPLYVLDNTFESTSHSTNFANGSTSSALQDLKAENIEKEIEWNKWLESIREGYITFIMFIKDRKFPFFNQPLAVTKAFKDLLS